ncbi:MAG: hypothetical protein MUF87_01545 [Anaerolineae bacterium]|jgi:hypothetical protein|nr:hypothetical protein [Anaerolineae bacterium]
MRAFFGCSIYLFLVFPILFVGLFLASISMWIFERDFYKDLFSNPDFYVNLLDSEALQTSFQVDLGNLPQESVNAGIRAALTPEYLRSQMGQVIDQIFDGIETRQDEINVSFDLMPLKEHLRADGALLFAQAAADELPVCEGDIKPLRGMMPTCRPESVPMDTTVEQIQGVLSAAVEDLPDEWEFKQPLQMGDVAPEVPLDELFRVPSYFLLGIGAILTLITAVIGARYARSRWTWIGLMVMLPALLILGISSAIQNIELSQAMINEVAMESGEEDLTLSFLTLATNASSRVSESFIQVSGIALLIGALCLLIAFVSRRHDPYDDPRVDDHLVYIPEGRKRH